MPLDIVVAMVAGQKVYRRTAACLIDMLSVNNGSADLAVHLKADSILARGRHELLEQALQQRRTHVLFVDSDQTFPPDTLHRLLSWRKPVVACNVATKTFPSSPTARIFNPDNPKGEPLFTTGEDQGLRRVWRIGTGIMLIELREISHLPRPFFLDTWKPEMQAFQGEDWYFCELLEKYDIKIYVDQGLSWEVGHVGDCEYRHEMTLVGGRYQTLGSDGTIVARQARERSESVMQSALCAQKEVRHGTPLVELVRS